MFGFNNINNKDDDVRLRGYRCRAVWQLVGRAAWQLGGRAAGRPAAVAIGRPIPFAVGRWADTAENTKYIFRSGGSSRQRQVWHVQHVRGFRWF